MSYALLSNVHEGVFADLSSGEIPIGILGPKGFEKAIPVQGGKSVKSFKQDAGDWGLEVKDIVGVALASGKLLPDHHKPWLRLWIKTEHGWVRLKRFTPGPDYVSLREKFFILPAKPH